MSAVEPAGEPYGQGVAIGEGEGAMLKVLVVDDSLFARMNICDMLKDAGYDCLQAQNGREGLEKVRAENPDCILSDLLMPELDGIGFLKSLREQGNRVPVIVLSADVQDSKRSQCLELGTAGFLSKPPRKDEILDMVGKVLSSQGGSTASFS